MVFANNFYLFTISNKIQTKLSQSKMTDQQLLPSRLGNYKRHSVGINTANTSFDLTKFSQTMPKGGHFTQKRATVGSSTDHVRVAGFKQNRLGGKNNAYGVDNDKNRGSGQLPPYMQVSGCDLSREAQNMEPASRVRLLKDPSERKDLSVPFAKLRIFENVYEPNKNSKQKPKVSLSVQASQDKRNFTKGEGEPSDDKVRKTIAKEKLRQLGKITSEFYATCAVNELSKTVKQQSFRALQNRESESTDLFESMKEKRKQSLINNPSALKWSHQEHEPLMVGNQKAILDNTVKLHQKAFKTRDPVLGESKVVQSPGIEIVPHSKLIETYYDMLLTQKRPFNRTMGTINTPLVYGVKPYQQMRQAVPSSKLSPTQSIADRLVKTSIASPRSISEIPGGSKASKVTVGAGLHSSVSKGVQRKASLAKTMILAKDSMRSDLIDMEASMSEMKQVGPPSPTNSYRESHRKLQESSRVLKDAIDCQMKKNIKDIKSQKLRQQPININSRNELLLQHNEPKGITPLKYFEFQFQHESQDDFIDGPKKLHLNSKDEKMFVHQIGIGPVHQDIKLVTDKARDLHDLAQRQQQLSDLRKTDSPNQRHSLLDQMNQMTPKKSPPYVRDFTRELETPDYTISEFESIGNFKVANPDFSRAPFNTMSQFANYHRGSVTSNAGVPGSLRTTGAFGDIKRGSYPIESTTQPKGFQKLQLLNSLPRERTSESVETTSIMKPARSRKNPFVKANSPGPAYATVSPEKIGCVTFQTDSNAQKTLMSQTITRANTRMGKNLSMNYNIDDIQMRHIQHKLSKYSPLKEGGDGIGKKLKRPREFFQ